MPIIEYENLGRVNASFFTAYEAACKNVLQSGWYILGKSVTEFEKEYAAYCGSRFTVGVANGLDALTLAIKTLNCKPGDEILVPSNTYIATILSILHNQLVPVLVEPELATYNIDPEKIEEKITNKTKAILVVHLYGKLCRMDLINAIANKHGLFVIEDCAQAHGASLNGRCAGNWGHTGAHSFYPTKNLGAIGDGGAITTNDEAVREQLVALRNYGSTVKYRNDIVGYNSRLDELQAAFLSVKLKRLNEINEHKRKLASVYTSMLKEDFVRPVSEAGYDDVFHIYPVRHPRRDQLKQYLLSHGIGTEIHYPIPPNRQPAMKGILDGQHTPIAEEIHRSILSLPISFCHSEEDVAAVAECMNKF